MRVARALIRLDSLKNNIAAIRNYIGAKPMICVPVKDDAYGHGAVKTAESALRFGADFLAVATVREGAELRDAGISAPVLLFSISLPEEIDELVKHNLTPFVCDREYTEMLGKAAKKAGVTLPVHIKIDTGMGRIGCKPESAADLAVFISSIKSLSCEGTATHFAVSDSTETDAVEFTQKQLALFNTALDAIRKAGLNTGIVHAANSGAILLHKDAYFDMVRPGILLYGYAPSKETSGIIQSEPLMELVSNISFIKSVKKGESISYGGTWTADKDTVIGTIPVGYGDGFPRGLSNNFHVLINGKSYPIAGRICMDQCMVNLGDNTSVKRWESVSIFGGHHALYTAADIAEKLNTIPYEILCNINKRVPRVYI